VGVRRIWFPLPFVPSRQGRGVIFRATPLRVILFPLRGTDSELLWFEERICQIDKQPQTNDPADDIFPIHVLLPIAIEK